MTATEKSARAILAAKLREYRQRAGYTIYEVGEMLGKSGKTISAWETGHGQPDAEMFVKLYELYGMDSMSEFYDIADHSKSAQEAELLTAFRALNDAGKTLALATIKAYANSGEYEKAVNPDHSAE